MLKRINELFTPPAEVIDQAWVFNKVAPGMAPKFQPRPESAAGGMTPLYVSVDLGLDRILEVLKDKPDANTALVILSDGDDTGSSSKYFGRNFCTPEDVPTGYNCIKDGGRRCCKRVLGVCVKRCDNPDVYTPVDDVKVREEFKIATLNTRLEWCKANNLGDAIDETGYTGQKGQVNSLVGIIGSNFPNTKIYYLDMLDPDNGNQATRIGRECAGEVGSTYTTPTGDTRQVLQVFLYDNNTLDTLMQGVAGAVSTTISDPEIGKQVCKWKFGDGFTNFVFEDVENQDEIGDAGFNNEILETCEGPIKPTGVTGNPMSVTFTRTTYLPKPGEGYYTAATVLCQLSDTKGTPNDPSDDEYQDLLGNECDPP